MRIDVRSMSVRDIPAVQELQRTCFPGIAPWPEDVLRAQIARFSEGQIVATIDGRLVATSSSLIVKSEAWNRPHTLSEVSDDGRISTHDPHGDALYGIDIAVDPHQRGMRLARRVYDARKAVIRKYNLRAFLIAGRMPGFAAQSNRLDATSYIRKVVEKELTDPVVTTQMANGFAIRAILPGYLPSDRESCGHAVFMEWLNPDYVPAGAAPINRVRLAAAQLQVRPMATWEEFAAQCAFFVDAAGDQRADFVIFPELFIAQLQPTVSATRPGLVARALAELQPRVDELFTSLAVRHNINIVAGSIFALEGRKLRNLSGLYRRDGSMASQAKLHITPTEERWLGVRGGDNLTVIPTDRGTVAILIGYDTEFPELARMAAHAGADICITPFAADLRQTYIRLRTCAHANAICNGMHAVLCGACGGMPQVAGSDLHYAQSCILTPCDLGFAGDGVAAEAPTGVETLLVQDVDLNALRRYRRQGSVRHAEARRRDLYRLRWTHDQRAKQI
jgi:predicted amidohydrolase/ribosomal protein S18 acetylase RimI-like enzyme